MKDYINYGFKNEDDYVIFILNHLKNGISNFAFKGSNGVSKIYKDIIDVKKANHPTSRKSGTCNKGDVILIDKFGEEFPISIKMNNVKTTWESADYSLKHVLYKFVQCYGRITIPNNCNIRIDYHEENLEKYVFGDDILDKSGTISVQTINNAKVLNFNSNTILIKTHRLFNDYNDIKDDQIYKPVISVRKDSSRNKSDPLINGYRIEVVPNYMTVSINNIIDLI